MARLSSPSRRSVLAGGLAGGLAAPFVRPARAADATIVLAAYSGIFEENYRAAVVEPFMAANPGIKVTYYEMGASAQTLGLLRAQKAAPQIDVVMFDVSVAKAASDEGLLESIEGMPVLGELSPRAFTKGVVGAAVTFDNLVLLYSPPKVTPPPTSWKAMWDKKYAGEVILVAPPDIVGIGFTLVANKVFGGTDYRSSTEAGINAVAELAPGVLTYDPKPDPYAFIINGQASLGVGWNARGQLYSGQSEGKLAVVLPDEGSLFQVNIMAPVKNARQPAAAKAFVAYALGAAAQKAFTERMFYAPVNTRAQVSAEAMARTAATPERMARMLDVDWLEVAKLRDGITEQWRRRIINRR